MESVTLLIQTVRGRDFVKPGPDRIQQAPANRASEPRQRQEAREERNCSVQIGCRQKSGLASLQQVTKIKSQGDPIAMGRSRYKDGISKPDHPLYDNISNLLRRFLSTQYFHMI